MELSLRPLPCHKTLTGVLPYGNARDSVITFRIVTGDRPPRPTGAQRLQSQIWDMIVTCWSEKREQRWDIHAVHNRFSASSVQGIPAVEPGNQCASQTATYAEGFAVTQTTIRRLNAAVDTPPEDLLPLLLFGRVEGNYGLHHDPATLIAPIPHRSKSSRPFKPPRPASSYERFSQAQEESTLTGPTRLKCICSQGTRGVTHSPS